MINHEGFLSDEIKNIELSFIKEFNWQFDLVKKYNIYFQETSFKLKIHKNNILHWCIAALYIRSLSNFQSIVILVKKGLTSEANTILKSLYEIKFIIKAISLDNSLFIEYLGQEAIEMKRIITNSKKWEVILIQNLYTTK